MRNKPIKMKLNKALCSVLVIFVCSVLCMGSSCVTTKRDYAEVFENNWNVKLPENMQELFRDSDHNWGHFGIRYAVFKLEEEPTDFIEDFNKESNIEIEDKVNNFLDWADFEIPEEYLPDWEEEYCWKLLEKEYLDGEIKVLNECCLVYFYDLSQLAISQCFR